MLYHWLYISTAKVLPRSPEDVMIYLHARNRNADLEITGYLHRENGYYTQYVEGPKNALDQLKLLINKDWRHENIRSLSEGHTPVRRFSGWDMAFTDEEISSFRAVQTRFGYEPDISKAPVQEILHFMDQAVLSGDAQSVADVA
ncbi:BLUF domain-containing protein [Roseicyclus sp. F158]|uniref:BLUF domain-containing protein n=1 Tax=Tropicimonas omnivorans TaxID=3075590 RepID=A0ABU3DEW2_9RHOB|nr:BLUF domain-containing protein [Roseicyclus sp. F158]MDT0682217.1 BLUF domain-containing protein [Roseicyclus sp. F158]